MSNYPDGMTAAHWRHIDGRFPAGTEDLLGKLVEFPEDQARWSHGSLLFDREQKLFAIGLGDTGDEAMRLVYTGLAAGTTAIVPFKDLVEVGKAVEFEEWEDDEGFGVTITIANRHGNKATVEQAEVVELEDQDKEALECLASL